MLTVDQVREALSYNPETGVLTWRTDRMNGRGAGKVNIPAGSEAGFITAKGYRRINLHKVEVMAHRIAWLHFYGKHPVGQIDHIDGNRSNNAIANLRECDHRLNQGNRPKAKNNLSGFKGVFFDKRTKKFQASIKVNGKALYLGRYPTAEEAHAAYLRAANHYFGEFARAG